MDTIVPFLYFSVRILRFFIPREDIAVSPHPHIPALNRKKRDSSAQNLSDWATSILAFHHSPESVLEWQILSVQWFKNKSGLEHEYPVFTLRNILNPNTEVIYLRLDRRSSVEALKARKEEIIVKRDVHSVRNVFRIRTIVGHDLKSHSLSGPKCRAA